MGKKPADVPPASLALYEKLVATSPGIERKGAANPYTSLNGHMFSFLTKSGRLGLRLPGAEREAFIKKHRTKLCESYGTVMKEYVEVPATLLKKTRDLAPYFAMSVAYIGTLKPKPTTRKKTTKKAPKKTAKSAAPRKAPTKKVSKKPVAKKKTARATVARKTSKARAKTTRKKTR